MKRFLTRACILLILSVTFFKAYSQTTFPVSGTTLNSAANGVVASVAVPSLSAIDQQLDLRKRELHLLLDAGDLYQLGNQAWSITFNFTVSIKKGAAVLGTNTVALTVNQDTPDKEYIIEFQNYVGATSIDISKTGYVQSGTYTSTPGTVNSKIRFNASVKDVVGRGIYSKAGAAIVPQNLKVTPFVEAGQVSKAKFSWEVASNQWVESYDLQLLKVEPDLNGAVIVNWDQATLIEVNTTSYLASYEMTLAEGTGFYLWRVKPVGSYFEGGRTFWKNHGQWTATLLSGQNGVTNQFFGAGSPPVPNSGGKILNNEMAGVSGYYFYYNQFDENKNFIYNRV